MTYAEHTSTDLIPARNQEHNVTNEPVTKEEATMFMSRLTTTLVGYSEQAKTIEQLQVQINELNTRVNNVLAESQNLRNEVYQVTAERTQAQREAKENLELAQTYERERNDLQTRLTQVTDDYNQTFNSLSDVRSSLYHANNELDTTKAQRDVAQKDLEYWRERAQRSEADRDRLQGDYTRASDRLGKLQNVFNDMFNEDKQPGAERTIPKYEDIVPVEKPQF